MVGPAELGAGSTVGQAEENHVFMVKNTPKLDFQMMEEKKGSSVFLKFCTCSLSTELM